MLSVQDRLEHVHRELAFSRLVNAVEQHPSEDETVICARAEGAMLRILNEDGLREAAAVPPPAPATHPSPWFWLAVGLAVAAALAFATVPAPAAERIEGRATATDGDTIAVEGTDARIRLYGIDAPENGQTCDDASGKRYLCGTRAADYLAELIGRSVRVQCFQEDRDRYGRIVAECAVNGSTVVNAEMVRAGWAVEYKEYSDGRYDQEEADAKASRRGMWQGRFVVPSKWRRGDRLETERVADGQPKSCAIKGNISGNGRIYHMPGQQNYTRTQIDQMAGEKWFCSATEAEAAGWRAARR